ncbi:MAG: YSC84-related protein [Rhodoferax sp.]
MKLKQMLTAATVILSLLTGSAFAAGSKAEKQAELRSATQKSVEKFYKADPKLQGEVKNAAGYAVFTTYGLSFVIGGAGGKGLAHDNKTGKDVFMAMAQASAGPQIGLSESETLIIFKSAKGMQQFVDKGWTIGTGGSLQVGAGGKSAGPAEGAVQNADASYFTLTKNGIGVGIAADGTKFWKDDELN